MVLIVALFLFNIIYPLTICYNFKILFNLPIYVFVLLVLSFFCLLYKFVNNLWLNYIFLYYIFIFKIHLTVSLYNKLCFLYYIINAFLQNYIYSIHFLYIFFINAWIRIDNFLNLFKKLLYLIILKLIIINALKE